MPPANRQSLLQTIEYLQSNITPVLVFVMLIAALVIFVAAPVLFFDAIKTPFIGAFVEHTLIISGSRPIAPGPSSEALRLPFGHQVQAVDGQHVSSVAEMRDVLEQHQPGQVVDLDIAHPQEGARRVAVELSQLSVLDQLGYFIAPYLTGLIYLLSALYVFVIRRHDPAGRAFAIFSGATAISLATLFDLNTTNTLTPLWAAALALAGGGLVNLALLFPESVGPVTRNPLVCWSGYLLSLVLAVASSVTIYNFNAPTAYVWVWRIEYLYLVAGIVLFLGLSIDRWRRASSPVVREQARLIFWGGIAAFSPLGLWLLITVLWPAITFTPVLLLSLAIFPIFVGYAIVRYRLLRTDFLISRTVLYGLLAGLAMAGYGLLVSGLTLVFGDWFKPTNPLVIGVIVFALALALNPLRLRLQEMIDRYFFRGQIVFRELQQALSRELTQVMELSQMVRLLRRYVEQAFSPQYLHIFVYDPLSGHYGATQDLDGHMTSDIRFPASSPFVRTLSSQRESLFLADINSLPAALQPEQARLMLLSASLFTPLLGRSQLIGWLALGNRRSGEPYTNRDLAFLESLSDQAALAVERAQVVGDLERRVREMNVLTRVAQGVSFTVAFDDILEMISAQTNQVLPARDLKVTLIDPETGVMSNAFYLENDERLTELEHRPLHIGQGLEAEVISTQRAIVTDDYERECRSRGLLPTTQGLYAWMGVPLNAGAQTIGALSVASRDPADTYTDEQRNLLQAIADQASGAIVKARSLEESESRARQLAKLNEIGVGLTSTLDIKPLLEQILESAVDILSCEAGTLFLMDNQTDELVFEVVRGPVAEALVGQRLAPGTGLVGQAVITGKPVIANDAKRRMDWSEKTDEETGFNTQDLLIVPMRIQDRVIGVIEVINKVNGAPFSSADQELLLAFTSQATIAIENARLYTMTDQALAARVEELSVMQRIDRELNASLDIERAMRITLDWAMRQSHAEAGFVGAVLPDRLRVMVAQGYQRELDLFLLEEDEIHHSLPLNLPALQAAIETGQPSCVQVGAVAGNGTGGGILQQARLQIVIPIRRETTTMGVMVLESTRSEDLPEDMLNFLMRLSDHAAIAIANAGLYEEVKEANLAKSRFVSFVAHELKNPMASIKGYTELVAQGMAGPVNEMQASFLGTVRSNVDRMNTIVTDLNDLTKIQVGNMRLEYKAVRVNEVLNEVMRSIQRQVEEKKQQSTVSLPDDLPTVWADPVRLSQILTNLVSNAHKYTPEESSFSVGAEVYIPQEGAMAGAKYVHLWIKDQGIGISEEDQKKIFTQYFRTDNAKEMASGTGLGLSITRSLIEMMGGRIWFESVINQGTTFHFTVPVAEVTEQG